MIPSTPDMTPSGKPPPDDIDLFRRSIGPIRKLRSDKVHHTAKRPAPRPRAASGGEPARSLPVFPVDFHGREISAGESLYFARTGLQQRLLQRLRRGQLPSEAELDLHGLTIAEAQNAVVRFLFYCGGRDLRTVRIIHGKGYGSRERAPVLKNHLNEWLREQPEVLAFCSSRPDQGGTGAVNVLLRSRR
jgi:DNA-nicking Smr family endonuclease